MTKTNKLDEAPLFQILIETGTQIAVERKMNLTELIGHFSIAYRDIYTRQIQAAHEKIQAERSEGGDKVKKMDASPVEDEGKV